MVSVIGWNSRLKKVLSVVVIFSLLFCFGDLPNVKAANIYYVSTSGSDNNAGSQYAPFASIQKGVDSATPGDTVIIEDGTYMESVQITKSGTANGYITIKAKNPKKVIVCAGAGYSDAIHITTGNYIIIDGLIVTNQGVGHGIYIEGANHVILRNNDAHYCGGSGIQAAYSDYYTIENNECHNNSNTNIYQCSGISIYEPRAYDSKEGYHIIISGNKSYNNVNLVNNSGGTKTDGNGIIIDDTRNSQTTGYPAYAQKILVENNLCYLNGGRGIHVFYSDKVTVRNNTTYNNFQNLPNAEWAAELQNQNGSNNIWVNNIAYANSSREGRAIHDSYSSNITWRNNIVYGGSVTVRDGSTSVIDSSTDNLINVNPLFNDTSNADFRIKDTSPAKDAATTSYGVSEKDIDGVQRPYGPGYDIGCYEYSGEIAPLPTQTTGPTPGAGELLSNWSFESGTTSWNTWGSDAVQVVVAPVYEGQLSLKCSSRKGTYSSVTQNVLEKLKSNGMGKYTTSLYAKMSSVTDGVRITMMLTDSNGTKYISFPSTICNSNEFTKVNGILELTWTGALTAAWIYVETDSTLEDIYIDNFSLIYSSSGAPAPTPSTIPTPTPSTIPTPTPSTIPTPTPSTIPTPTPTGSSTGKLDRTGWSATASNTWDLGGYESNKALDENNSTRWCSGVYQNEQLWFMVDMKSEKEFNKIELICADSSEDYIRGCQVYVSNDGVNWGSAVGTATGTEPTVTINFSTQSARYIKIIPNTTYYIKWWSIYELYVYGNIGAPTPTPSTIPTPTPTGSSTGKLERTGWSATASNTWDLGGYESNKALDENNSTRWCSGVYQNEQLWFMVDMKSEKEFNKIELVCADSSEDYIRGCQVYVSNDGVNWGSAVGTATGTEPTVTINFSTQSARYIKIIPNTTYYIKWWSIYEIYIYGSVGAPTSMSA